MHGIVCYLYLFTCGSYLGWAFWPNIPFLAILGSSVKRGEVTKGSFWCWRSPVLAVYLGMVGTSLFVNVFPSIVCDVI